MHTQTLYIIMYSEPIFEIPDSWMRATDVIPVPALLKHSFKQRWGNEPLGGDCPKAWSVNINPS